MKNLYILRYSFANNNKKNIYLFFTFLLFMTVLSCSKKDDYQDNYIETDTHTIAITTNKGALSRTTIDTSDWATTRWAKNDAIYLWATNDGGASYELNEEEFALYYYNSSFNNATFTASIPSPMTGGTYNYYATYPKPKSVSGTTVTHEIPSTQSGYYDGIADIMLAYPTSGDALTDVPDSNINLSFKHQTHILRIEVDSLRDLAKNTTKLEIHFPQNVIGDISYNITNPNNTPTLNNASNIITIDCDTLLSSIDYLWVFISPTTINGNITFIGYTQEGYKTKSISTTIINKNMQAGGITPIKLTIPEILKTTLTLNVTKNNLGEEIENITFTAPTGAKFLGELSSITLPYNTNNKYTVEYHTPLYETAFNGGEITVNYESEHAIVQGESIQMTSAMSNKETTFTDEVPYLFEDDFSNISNSSYFETSDGPLPGRPNWQAGQRSEWWQGKSIAIRSYSNWGGPFSSWIRLNKISNIKANKNISIKIMFNADWKKNESNSMKIKINDVKTISLSNNSSANEDNIPTQRNTTLDNISNTSPIIWKTDGKNGGWFNYDYIYLDNVKVQIAN